MALQLTANDTPELRIIRNHINNSQNVQGAIMYEGSIRVSSLKGVQFLCENDLYELARLVIRLHKAKNEGTNAITSQTVYGLANAYATLAGVSRDEVEAVMNASGLPSEAEIVDDELRGTCPE